MDTPLVYLLSRQAGVNVPMLLRAIAYRHEAGAAWVQRAVDGGHNGIALPGAAT